MIQERDTKIVEQFFFYQAKRKNTIIYIIKQEAEEKDRMFIWPLPPDEIYKVKFHLKQ